MNQKKLNGMESQEVIPSNKIAYPSNQNSKLIASLEEVKIIAEKIATIKNRTHPIKNPIKIEIGDNDIQRLKLNNKTKIDFAHKIKEYISNTFKDILEFDHFDEEWNSYFNITEYEMSRRFGYTLLENDLIKNNYVYNGDHKFIIISNGNGVFLGEVKNIDYEDAVEAIDMVNNLYLTYGFIYGDFKRLKDFYSNKHEYDVISINTEPYFDDDEQMEHAEFPSDQEFPCFFDRRAAVNAKISSAETIGSSINYANRDNYESLLFAMDKIKIALESLKSVYELSSKIEQTDFNENTKSIFKSAYNIICEIGMELIMLNLSITELSKGTASLCKYSDFKKFTEMAELSLKIDNDIIKIIKIYVEFDKTVSMVRYNYNGDIFLQTCNMADICRELVELYDLNLSQTERLSIERILKIENSVFI
jgi:hypothetical protein